MAKAQTYIKDIRAQVRADHGGKVPDHLNLTIRNYANALEMRDTLQAEIAKEGATITEVGSMGQVVKRQQPSPPCRRGPWRTSEPASPTGRGKA